MKDSMVKFIAIGPDEIPLREKPFKTEEEAAEAIRKFSERFTTQGYYRDADGEAIELCDIPKRCRIEVDLT